MLSAEPLSNCTLHNLRFLSRCEEYAGNGGCACIRHRFPAHDQRTVLSSTSSFPYDKLQQTANITHEPTKRFDHRGIRWGRLDGDQGSDGYRVSSTCSTLRQASAELTSSPAKQGISCNPGCQRRGRSEHHREFERRVLTLSLTSSILLLTSCFASCRQYTGEAYFFKADVTNWDNLIEAFDAALAALGSLQVVLPNAGVSSGPVRFVQF